MSEQELQQIWKFTRHISRQSEKRVENTFDLTFEVYKSKLLMDRDSYIMTKKERIFFIHSFWGYRTYKSRVMEKRYRCGWDITDLDDGLIKKLKKKNWDTTNLKRTFDKVQANPEFKKAKRNTKLAVILE
ncbi:hypothetical protein [Psychroflexus montanilacus]|uniref:hypothetical protein n=1 Tax=Psychroflexus montanilacus TaxID=2873598 RepID=UPI001CCB16C1|nr:hypothetical protein [Psychroflexus montanilacus]MBZ9652651.1 hypothetical protein [Psychroflexus montanilacus]